VEPIRRVHLVEVAVEAAVEHAEQAPSKALSALVQARKVATTTKEAEEMEEVLLTPGSSRAYSRAELVLSPHRRYGKGGSWPRR